MNSAIAWEGAIHSLKPSKPASNNITWALFKGPNTTSVLPASCRAQRAWQRTLHRNNACTTPCMLGGNVTVPLPLNTKYYRSSPHLAVGMWITPESTCPTAHWLRTREQKKAGGARHNKRHTGVPQLWRQRSLLTPHTNTHCTYIRLSSSASTRSAPACLTYTPAAPTMPGTQAQLWHARCPTCAAAPRPRMAAPCHCSGPYLLPPSLVPLQLTSALGGRWLGVHPAHNLAASPSPPHWPQSSSQP